MKMSEKKFRKNPKALRKRTNLTLDPVVWERAQEHCYAEGISVSEFVNQVLAKHVEEKDRSSHQAARKRSTRKKK